MKTIHGIALILIAAFLTIAAVNMVYGCFIILDIKTVSMDIKVMDKVGFNVDPDALHFGITMPGGKAVRYIDTAFNGDSPVRVSVQFSGELAPWTRAAPDRFILLPDETGRINFTVSVPRAAAYGKYNGTATIIYRRAFG
ncbi:MAG: hypothetical protein ABH879_06345 [archaeon]